MRPCLKHKIINVLWLTQDDPSTGLFSNPGGNCNELSLSILILRHPSKSCLEQGEKKKLPVNWIVLKEINCLQQFFNLGRKQLHEGAELHFISA